MLPFSKSMFANILTFGFYLRVERHSVLVNDTATFDLSSNKFTSKHEFFASMHTGWIKAPCVCMDVLPLSF
jgi:hypothetical protein